MSANGQREQTPKRANGPKGRYLYAVLPAGSPDPAGLEGLDGSEVFLVTEGSVSAVVSRVPSGIRLRPERRSLTAHLGVLRSLMTHSALLPAAFGAVAESEASLRNILALNEPTFLRGLSRVAGKVEMALKVRWDVPNVYEHLVHLREDLRDARDRVFGSGREPSREDRLELGRFFERVLSEEREPRAVLIEAALSPHATELKRDSARDEGVVVNLLFLVPKHDLPRFEAAVEETARLFDDTIAFDYTGPWPPYSFVEVKVEA